MQKKSDYCGKKFDYDEAKKKKFVSYDKKVLCSAACEDGWNKNIFKIQNYVSK